jgi:serine/threonine protein phosphatase PrpC
MAYIIVTTSLFIALIIIRIAIGNTSGIAKIDFGFAQTPGNRQVNADEIDWAYHDNQLLLAVADGIGPGDKAHLAAKTAVHIITRVFEQTGVGGNPAYFFMNCFKGANSTVLRYIPDSTAGASLLGVVVKDNHLYYALAGNCKVSVLRKRKLYDLSEGHTFDVLVRRAFLRKKINRVEALEAVKESRLYNFVGKDGFRDLEMFDTPVSLKKGDIILLMTDGVYDFCDIGEVEKILSNKWSSSEVLAQRIICALDRDNHPDQDNASVIVAKINAL